MEEADLEGELWSAAAACELEEAGRPELGQARSYYGMEAIMAESEYWEPLQNADAGSAQEVNEGDTEVLRQQQQRTRWRQDMLSRLRLCSHCPRQHDFERRLQGAAKVAELLRGRMTFPAEMEQQGNWQDEAVRLPRVSCAFRTCPGMQYVDEAGVGEDETLRDHILANVGKKS